MPLRALLLALCLPLPLCALADEPLQLVADRWPPYADAQMPGRGLAVHFVSVALTRAGYAISYAEVPWPRALHGVRTGEYDVVVDAWYSDERATYGEFSEPYLNNRLRLIKRTGSPIAFERLSDLYPYPLAVVRGYSYSAELESDRRVQKVPVLTFGNAAAMVAAGRVELTLEDELTARYLLNRELRELRDKLEFLPKPLSENPLHILVSRANPHHAEIVAAFNRELAQMRADGSYDAFMSVAAP
ncbi:substrate-binding periplasmic protein [Pseudomonas panipatensis]|uniref:Polar amino acid transport system substrate-binding protein n=1 Tax=Pseudomonas panipatensis TaxID=428992 RepID=A0A1G8JAW0_9PSED|nr:transporter substrate-binding domain-containing protein [Pseudomonas panipatensis]SDI28117.1 polar amino acid transport system substrate-binding protein [Pseudomonas panipatensis]SMP50446.1 amino acid ABC transporter substrate-binding protein, PAAT family [Pseudomonas panipatensis]